MNRTRSSGPVSLLALFAIFPALLASCSFSMPDVSALSDLLGAPSLAPTGSATATSRPRPSASASPTQPTATFTFTPTLIGAKTPTASPPPTATPTALLRRSTAVPVATLTATLNMDGLAELRLSATEFHSGECAPNRVVFTVRVGDPARVAYVVLFARFKSTLTGATGPWTSLTMNALGSGSYTYELTAAEMEAFGSFDNPWVQYQLVTTDARTQVLGRTQIFDERLSLKTTCVPTATTTAATPGP